MNQYHIKKMLMTLGLSGTMVLVSGCSEKEEVTPKKTIEKELEYIEPTMEPISIHSSDISEESIVMVTPKEKKNSKIKRKERLLKEIEKSEFDSLTKDILRSIAKASKDEITQNRLLIACTETKESLRDMWLYDTIMEATREQKIIGENYFQYYSLEKLKILNNLDGRKKDVLKDIEVMANISTYGNYRFYEGISGLETQFLVADRNDRVLLVANNDTVKSVKNYKLQKFETVLKKYGITSEQIYCSETLLDEVLPLLSIKMNESTIGDLQSINTSDILVLDSSTLADSEDYNQRYYFLKYRCLYLFDSGMPKIYTDIFNPDANAVIGDSITFYRDSNKEHCMYDTFTPGHDKPCYSTLTSFLKSQGISSLKQISYEELKEIHEKVNKRGSKVLKKIGK